MQFHSEVFRFFLLCKQSLLEVKLYVSLGVFELLREFVYESAHSFDFFVCVYKKLLVFYFQNINVLN